MGLILNGNAPNKILYNGAEVSLYFNGSKIWPNAIPVLDEVTIGTQTWKTKNLAVNDGQGGIYPKTINYGQGDVVEYFYTWAAAVRVAASISGWHLPTQAEWNTLAIAVGGSSIAGKKLKSTYGWIDNGNGTDDYGFTLLPVGFGSPSYHEQVGETTILWTSEQKTSSYAYGRIFFASDDSIDSSNPMKTDVCSVRLIKDS